MKRMLSTKACLKGFALFLIVLMVSLLPAHAAPTDAQDLQLANKTYFEGFPTDRSVLLALGQEGNAFAAMMLERTWQRPSFGPVSESDARHWRERAVAADINQRLQALAKRNDAIAMMWLGNVYGFGLLGATTDPTQSTSWYRRSAEGGNAIGQRLYAGALLSGEGVAKDEAAAYRWYLKSAMQGDAVAQYATGVAYWNGKGVGKDKEQAVSWFHKAAAQGYADALDAVGIVEYEAGNHCAMIDAWEAGAPGMDSGKTHSNLAMQYRKLGNLALARHHAQRALAKGGLDAEYVGWMGEIIESTEQLRHVDVAALAWSSTGDAGALGYQAMFDALDDKAFVITYDTSVSYTKFLSCGPGRDFLVETGSVHPDYPMTIRMYYRFDKALGLYRAFPKPWISGAASETELTMGGEGQLLTNTVEIDRKGRRRVTHLGRSELAVMRDGAVRQSTPAGIITSKMKDQYAVLIPGQGAVEAARQTQGNLLARKEQEQQQKDDTGGGMFRSLVGAAVVAGMASAGGLDGDQVVGAALKGAQIFNPDSAGAAALGAAGDQMLGTGGGTAGGLASAAGAVSGSGGYATKPNLATSACAGFTEGNYRQKAVSGGGDQQLYAMCGQAFEYYTMYKRAIAQGYSEADANRTYAAHQQSAQVAQGYLQSHGAN